MPTLIAAMGTPAVARGYGATSVRVGTSLAFTDQVTEQNTSEAEEDEMAEQEITRDKLAELLNEDLSREYQAIIAYVVYSQVLKGAEYMNIADQLVEHAHQELEHALTLSR